MIFTPRTDGAFAALRGFARADARALPFGKARRAADPDFVDRFEAFLEAFAERPEVAPLARTLDLVRARVFRPALARRAAGFFATTRRFLLLLRDQFSPSDPPLPEPKGR